MRELNLHASGLGLFFCPRVVQIPPSLSRYSFLPFLFFLVGRDLGEGVFVCGAGVPKRRAFPTAVLVPVEGAFRRAAEPLPGNENVPQIQRHRGLGGELRGALAPA